MNLDEMRSNLESFRNSVDREAKARRDSLVALERLTSLYERFDSSERALADVVLAEWVLSDNEAVRFDAQYLIDVFGLVATVPALKQLLARLGRSTWPGAPFESEKVMKLILTLQQSLIEPRTPD